MGDLTAVRVALDLMHVPSRVRLIRRAPLPDGVPFLLRIAAGDEEAQTIARELTGRPEEMIQHAAGFFIEQALLFPEADSYRVLGATPETTAGDLRRNMAFLLHWLHPDRNKMGDRSVFASRVTLAWENLKTPERREAYDEARNTERRNSQLRNGLRQTRRRKRMRRKGFGVADGYEAYEQEAGSGLRALLRRLFVRGEHR